MDEVGIDVQTGIQLVAIDPTYFRPTEVELLIGDPRKAKEVLGWEAKVELAQLVNLMVAHDLTLVRESLPASNAAHFSPLVYPSKVMQDRL